jgi:hypothetical protein
MNNSTICCAFIILKLHYKILHCKYIWGWGLICTLLEFPQVGKSRIWSSDDCILFSSRYPHALRPILSYQYISLNSVDLQLCEVLTWPPDLAWPQMIHHLLQLNHWNREKFPALKFHILASMINDICEPSGSI